MFGKSSGHVPVIGAAALASLAISSTGWAHALLQQPAPRDQSTNWKPGTSGFVQPCGAARRATQPVTQLKAGSTITVRFEETVYHPGCFLIDLSSDDASFQMLANVPHKPARNATYEASVTLPSAPCERCTLRLRQVMTEGLSGPCPPANMPANAPYLYFSCANVALTADDASTPRDAGAQDARPATSDARASQDAAGTTSDAGATATGGTSGAGGASGSGGASASGGSSGAAPPRRDAAVTPGMPSEPLPEDPAAPKRSDGGGCSFAGAAPAAAPSLLLGLAAALGLVRRRRARR